ncbi:hypothetical protein ACRJ4B_05210 [Streptomyces sp. GTA36]
MTQRGSAVVSSTPEASSPMSPKRALPSPSSLSRETVYVTVVVVFGRSASRSASMRWVATGFGSVRVRVARTVPRRSTPAGDERTWTVPLTSYVPGPGLSLPPGSGPVATVLPSRRRVQVPDVRQVYRTEDPARPQVAGADRDVPTPPPLAHRLTEARCPPSPFRVPAGAQSMAGGGGSGARVRCAAPAGWPTAVQPAAASTAAAVSTRVVLRGVGWDGIDSSSGSGAPTAGRTSVACAQMWSHAVECGRTRRGEDAGSADGRTVPTPGGTGQGRYASPGWARS